MLERTSRGLGGFANGLAALVNGLFRVLGRPGKWLQEQHGPSQHRQVSYRARLADGQVEVQGPYD